MNYFAKEYGVNCECDQCFMELRDIALLLPNVDLFLRNNKKIIRVKNLKIIK